MRFKSIEVLFILIKTSFIIDYIRSFFNDKFYVQSSTYLSMRRLFVLTHGLSNIILAVPFRVKYRVTKKHSLQKGVLLNIKRSGCAVIYPKQKVEALSNQIDKHLAGKTLFEDSFVGADNNKLIFSNLEEALESPSRRSPRLFQDYKDVFQCQAVWDLVEELDLVGLASQYLHCQPILTQIASWYVLPLQPGEKDSEHLYDNSAQTYHFDMDWLQFIKFFINLSDVDKSQGPFEFKMNTHNGRFRHKDVRRNSSDSDVKSLRTILATGPSGTCFAADTSGLHRDGRAFDGHRHVLQVEFAISTFGVAYNYEYLRNQGIKYIPKSVRNNPFFSGRTLCFYS